MEEKQLNGFSKFIALLVISALVISIIIFTANGNGFTAEDPTLNDTPSGTEPPENDVTDTPTEGTEENDQIENTVPEIKEPVFKNVLTGLEITESEYNSRAYGIVIDPSETIYGLSYADIAIEFPTEMGTSRMLFFSANDEVIWKIGALMPTRRFITAMSSFFGGIIVANGEDDNVDYKISNEGALIDISKHSDCSYNENGMLYYTNEKLIEVALNRTQYVTDSGKYKSAPYLISEETLKNGIACADTVVIPYSVNNVTTLVYDGQSGKYIYTKNSSSKTDMLNGEQISFSNAFVLFADTTTYESSTASELVINIEDGGSGYYFNEGKMTELRWKTSNGSLVFTNLMGEVLQVNKGNAYITFYKASEYSNISMK